jgi:hypothetical protein
MQQPAKSAAAQLDAAFSATNNAESLVVISNNDRLDRTIFSQNLSETFVQGRVNQIWAGDGHTIYTAIPAECGTKARFTETHPTDAFSLKPVGFGDDDVSQNGDTFTVRKDGKELSSLVVQNGYVVQTTSEPREVQGHRVPKLTESFSDINDAPRIVVPTPNEVVFSPQLFSGSCPL